MTEATGALNTAAAVANSPRQVLFASLAGTAIEFFDFYIYATAAVLVFPRLFFPADDIAAATLASLATFAVAFLARPIGSALFGHFGDRVGRKTTLVAALLTMGISTVVIGMLPRGVLLRALANGGLGATVGESMVQGCPVASEGDPVELAYRRMRELDCGALPVVRDGRLVGMVSLGNISELIMVRSALEGAPDRAVTG